MGSLEDILAISTQEQKIPEKCSVSGYLEYTSSIEASQMIVSRCWRVEFQSIETAEAVMTNRRRAA
jgi:hypothetical protein